MLSINDFDVDENMDNDDGIIKPIIKPAKLYNTVRIGGPITYNINLKQFSIVHDIKINPFIGHFLQYTSNIVDVLYRDFLLKDMLKVPNDVKPQYIQSYIFSYFKQVRQSIIDNMPRIKKLKRLNLKMLTRTHTQIIYNNIDNIAHMRTVLYGYEAGQMFKARLVTTPFYILDNDGQVKLYNIQTNELTIPTGEEEGNFLAYFSYYFS